MFQIVQRIISEQMNIDPQTITVETRLVEDLKADSIDAAEMLMNIETELGKTIPDEAILSVHTVGDILKYLED